MGETQNLLISERERERAPWFVGIRAWVRYEVGGSVKTREIQKS